MGQELDRLEHLTGARVAYLTRLGQGVVPHPGMVVQENDLVHLAVETDRIGAVQRVLAATPAKED